MRISTQKQSARENPKRFVFKLSPMAAGCAALLFGMANAAYAQQTAPVKPDAAQADAGKDTPAMQTVTVSGIRRGIEDAISVKKNATSIVEAISAEDIGKLPDTSIAESIARMPGVAAQRVNGRAQTINFRGMSGDFAGTLLNGREQVSSGDNRGVEFDQYPSELLSGVVFYKTSDASLVGQGLSGTVDLQTVRPLAFGKRTMAVNVRGEHNSLGSLNDGMSANGNRVSLSYIDQFADRTVGVAVGFAHLDSPGQQKTFEAWGYPTGNGAYANISTLGGSKQYAVSTSNKRDGLMGVLEWRPNKAFSSTLDMYYSTFNSDTIKRGLEAGTVWGYDPFNHRGPSLVGTPVIQGNVATETSWSGVRPVLVTRPESRDDTLTSLGWNNKFDLNKDWTLVGDLSYSKAKRKETLGEYYAGALPGASDTLTVKLNGADGPPMFTYGSNYSDPASLRLIDSGGWGQDGYIKYPSVTDELKSLRFDAKRNLDGMFSSLDMGLNYSERTKDKLATEYQLYLKSSPTVIPANLLTAPSSLSYVGIPGVLGFDASGALSSGLYNLKQNLYFDIFEKNWNVTEKVTTGHAKLSLDTEVGSIPLRGNFGLQIIHADQSSTAKGVVGGSTDGQNQVTITGGKTYTDVLPSLNLAFSLPSDQTLRFGAARAEARPRMDQMVVAQHFSIDRQKLEWTGAGGNPKLEPWRANAYDVSYEKYFGKQAYLGAALYYKDLKSYIYSQGVAMDFTGKTDGSGLTAASNMGTFTQPVNGTGGKVKGVELTASVPMKLMTPALDGFGVLASVSRTASSIEANGPGSDSPLPGLSKWSSNLTLYYEKSGFSTRVSQRARGEFVGEVSSFSAKRETTVIKPEHIVDFQAGYEFETGTYKGLSLLFQVNNLTNEAYRTQIDITNPALKNYDTYGRTILFGVNYKL